MNRKRVYGDLSTLNKSVNVDKRVNKTLNTAVGILQNPAAQNRGPFLPSIV